LSAPRSREQAQAPAPRVPAPRRAPRRHLSPWSLAAAIAILLALATALAIVHWRRTDGGLIAAARGRFARATPLERESTALGGVDLLALHNENGEVARAYLRRPAALAPDYRILVVYAGLHTGASILELLPERPDRVLLAIQYPYRSPESLLDKARWVADARRAAARTVAGGMLGLTFLERQGLDLRRSVVVGSSLGTIFAALHGALDPRVPEVVLVHGGGDFSALVRAHVQPGWRVPIALALAAGPFYGFDPVHYVGRIAPRELVVIAARDDERFPLGSTLALFERAGEPKRLLWTESHHVHSYDRPLVDELVTQIEAALAPPAAGGG
jgi:dienelactone hydrolase